MANLFGRTPPMDPARAVPTGETIGSYTSYLDAQKAVDYLADEKFPVQFVSIVGNDLKMVERVTGRLNYPRVALSGAMTGAWFGLFIGLMLSFFGSSRQEGGPYLSVITAMLMGAAFWMLFGIIGYAAQRGKRDFTSTNQVLASSYDVIVSPEVAMEARRMLAKLPMTATAAQPFATHQQLPPQGSVPAPPRPEGWHDPYAAQPPATPADAATPGAAAGGTAAGPAAGPAPTGGTATPTEPTTPRGQFNDLPDGRPKYGIRVDTPRPTTTPPATATPPAAEDEAPRP